MKNRKLLHCVIIYSVCLFTQIVIIFLEYDDDVIYYMG